MKKLSELLRDLANRAEKAETKIEAVEQETSEKVHDTIDKSKAEAQARQDEFKAHVAKAKAAVGSDWKKLQEDHNERVQKIKKRIAAKKDAVNRKMAEDRADDAEEYARDSIYFASMAIDNAEVASLEAIEARAYAESLALSPSGLPKNPSA
jgi:hypothetical protein